MDKGSGSITTLAGADGIIDIPAGVEFLERGEKVEVELFNDAQPADLVVAGENTLLLEKLADASALASYASEYRLDASKNIPGRRCS
jgi:Molybdopterin biosynthesis enzyme